MAQDRAIGREAMEAMVPGMEPGTDLRRREPNRRKPQLHKRLQVHQAREARWQTTVRRIMAELTHTRRMAATKTTWLIMLPTTNKLHSSSLRQELLPVHRPMTSRRHHLRPAARPSTVATML